MKRIFLPIAVLISLKLVFPGSLMSATVSNSFALTRPQLFSKDTSQVFKYTRKALSFASKPMKIKYLKAYIDSAEMICQKKNIDIPDLLHLARAEYFFLLKDFIHASQEAMIALNLSEATEDRITQMKTMNFLGRYSMRTGLFKESIDYFNKSNDLARKEHLKGYMLLNYSGMADVYKSLGNIKEYRKALQVLIDASVKERDTLNLEWGLFYLGSSLTEGDRDFRKADSLLRKCLEISMVRKDTACTSLSLANMGWNFYLEKKYDSAIKLYNRSLTYSIPSKRYSNSANAFGNLGTIYRDMGVESTSLKYYLKSIEQAKLGKDIYNLSWVYHDLSELYLMKKDTSDAYKSYVLFKTYSDSLLKTNSTEGLMDARIRYEADSQNKEFELLSLRVKNQRLLIYGYTGLFILSLAILILLLSRAKINAKRRISEMNRKISEVTQANLRQQMNPHFIFNTLNSIQYYMYQHDKLATNNYLTKFSSLMRKVLENSQHTSVPLQDELDALTLYLELEMIRFKDKFDYKIEC